MVSLELQLCFFIISSKSQIFESVRTYLSTGQERGSRIHKEKSIPLTLQNLNSYKSIKNFETCATYVALLEGLEMRLRRESLITPRLRPESKLLPYFRPNVLYSFIQTETLSVVEGSKCHNEVGTSKVMGQLLCGRRRRKRRRRDSTATQIH